jgi:two-component system sensor kinase FixL
VTSLVHIVDDDAQVRAATAYLLEAHGFETAVHDGGVELLADPRLDRGCILLDIRMPDMTGHEVQEELARRGVALPVIVMSAHGDLTAAVKAMKLGAADFIQKPPSEDELVGAINRALEAFRRGADRRAAAQAAQAKLKGLSRREGQILQGLLAGFSNKAIARRLDLSPRTVEMHRANMMAELGVGTLSEALRIAIDGELPPLDSAAETVTPAFQSSQPATSIAVSSAVLGGPLQLVLESSGEATWDWNMMTGEVLLSQRRIEQLGLEPGSPGDRIERLQSLVHPDDRGAFQRALHAHLDGQTESYSCEYRIQTNAAGWRWQEARGRIVEREPGSNRPLRMLGTVKDITEQKLDEEKGRETIQLLELAQHGAGAGIWDIDLDTRQIRLCGRTREMLGLDPDGPEEISMDAWSELVHPDDLADTLATIERAVQTGEPCSAEYRVKGDPPRWLLSLGKIMRDGEGRPTRLIGLSQDISARKAADRESNRAQSELIHLSGVSAVGSMVSTLTHELSQPLTAMAHFARGIVRRLEASGALADQTLRDALAGAERSAQLAAEIVARLGKQAPDRTPERQPASLSALIRESCALALIDADAQGIRHSLDLDPRADRVTIDPVQFQQILLNLLRNATDALMEVPVPQRRLKVTTARLAEDEVAVEVADSGPGIAEELQGRLFEPFGTGKPDGTGIGLSVCRTIVESHGGRIQATTRPEGGAMFRFTMKA